jgi:hypothetical protein
VVEVVEGDRTAVGEEEGNKRNGVEVEDGMNVEEDE